MNNSPWRTEWFRLIGALACAVALQSMMGNWLLPLIIVFAGYITFFGWQLRQVLRWLKRDMSADLMPNSRGIIGHLVRHIYRHNRAIEKNHSQQQKTIQTFTDIISAIPSATVILGSNNEIEWANYPALLLLGIDAQKDVGNKIHSLIRQAKFAKQISKEGNIAFEMVSPVDKEITLFVQLAEYAAQKRLLLAHNISANIDSQRSRKTFIANASHELRTPLTVVAGYLEFMQHAPDLPETLAMPVNRALEQSENMRILIEDLLTLSRLEDKALSPKSISKIDVQKHLAGILQSLKDSGKLQHHSITTEIKAGIEVDSQADIEENVKTDTESLYLEASEKELDSVCYNFINNAIKYSEPDTEIHIVWEKINDKQLKFSVTDNGIGIAPEHIAHLTERFYRVDSGRSRRVGGTGLGLSIAKHIAERHHGHIEIHSHLGEGSTFSVILPIRYARRNPLLLR